MIRTLTNHQTLICVYTYLRWRQEDLLSLEKHQGKAGYIVDWLQFNPFLPPTVINNEHERRNLGPLNYKAYKSFKFFINNVSTFFCESGCEYKISAFILSSLLFILLSRIKKGKESKKGSKKEIKRNTNIKILTKTINELVEEHITCDTVWPKIDREPRWDQPFASSNMVIWRGKGEEELQKQRQLSLETRMSFLHTYLWILLSFYSRKTLNNFI